MYKALYRKYRPHVFSDVVGQKSIVQTLVNQITSNKISHAYLFSGPRGTGKTTVAKIFAEAVNCQNPVNGSPCGSCDACNLYENGLQVDIVEMDAASNNGVDNIRSLIDESNYMPQYGKYKVYIIDEVHMLSNSAFNALLKTLEEPVNNVIFILATTEFYKVPPTIASRCQRFQFKLLPNNLIVDRLKEICKNEGVTCTDGGLIGIAKMARGGLRDAVSLLEQCIACFNYVNEESVRTTFGELSEDTIGTLASYIEKGDVEHVVMAFQNQLEQGKSLYVITNSLYEHFRDAIMHGGVDWNKYQRYVNVLSELSEKVRYDNNYVVAESELLRLCQPDTTDELKHEIQELRGMVQQLLDNGVPQRQQQVTDDLVYFCNIPPVLRNISMEVCYV